MHALARPDGIVDLSGPPHVVDVVDPSQPSSRARGFHPGPLLAATQVSSWLPADYDGPSVAIELRNSCSLHFRYSFSGSMVPAAEAPQRRTLGGHTVELQQVVAGDWLQLWDGDRWLGSAMIVGDQARMEVSPECDTLEASAELHDRGLTRFAIHWELDADESLEPVIDAAEAAALTIEAQELPEPWGPSDAEQRIELRLANLCATAIDYAFAPTFEAAPEHTASLAGRSQRRVEIPVGWWLRYRALNEEWRGGATTSLDGGIVWISADCVDFGVADGDHVKP
jgi:hypothetical protein